MLRVFILSPTSNLLQRDQDMIKFELFIKKTVNSKYTITKNTRASKAYLLNCIRNSLPNDTTLIYVSCHGVNNKLILEEGVELSSEDIVKMCNRLTPKSRIILWTDACHFENILNEHIFKCEFCHLTASNLQNEALQSSVRSAVFTHEMMIRIMKDKKKSLQKYSREINLMKFEDKNLYSTVKSNFGGKDIFWDVITNKNKF